MTIVTHNNNVQLSHEIFTRTHIPDLSLGEIPLYFRVVTHQNRKGNAERIEPIVASESSKVFRSEQIRNFGVANRPQNIAFTLAQYSRWSSVFPAVHLTNSFRTMCDVTSTGTVTDRTTVSSPFDVNDL